MEYRLFDKHFKHSQLFEKRIKHFLSKFIDKKIIQVENISQKFLTKPNYQSYKMKQQV